MKYHSSEQIQHQVKAFDKFMVDALGPDKDESKRKLILFISRTLHQFNLNNQYQPADILADAYCRVIDKIRRGEKICNIPAFLNRMTFNIIREKSRENIKNRIPREIKSSLILEQYEVSRSAPFYQNNIDDKHIDCLLEALENISPDSREILDLRIVQGWSWERIRKYYETQGKDLSAACLRKRGQRALESLRQRFFAFNEAS